MEIRHVEADVGLIGEPTAENSADVHRTGNALEYLERKPEVSMESTSFFWRLIRLAGCIVEAKQRIARGNARLNLIRPAAAITMSIPRRIAENGVELEQEKRPKTSSVFGQTNFQQITRVFFFFFFLHCDNNDAIFVEKNFSFVLAIRLVYYCEIGKKEKLHWIGFDFNEDII